MEAKNNYLRFAFDPYKWIEDGIKIANDNGLLKESLSSRTSNSVVSGKNYNSYGYDPSSPLTIQQQFDINSGLGSFLDQGLLSDVETTYSNLVAKLDLGGDLQASRIKFTDRPLGVFSFAQASKGLIRAVEYYCNFNSKIISADLVYKGVINQGKENEINYFYYLDKEKNEVVVERRQEGTTKILQSCEKLLARLDSISGLVLPYDKDGKVVNKCGGNSLRFTSTIKKVYAYREKKGGGIAPYVDIYIASGQNWGFEPEQMLIQAMPNIMLARILEKSGVKVRIFAFFNQNYNSKAVTKFYMIKDYGAPTDLNKITVFLADTRFFRYWLWYACTGWNYDILGNDSTNGKAGSMENTVSFSSNQMPFIRNYVSYMIKSGQFPSQVVDKKLMIFGGVSISNGERLMDSVTQDKILDKFNLLSDYVQLQLSKTPKKVMEDIIKREKDKGKTISQTDAYIRGIITDVVTPTKEITPKAPNSTMRKEELRIAMQLDTQEQANEILQDRKKLLAVLTTLIK